MVTTATAVNWDWDLSTNRVVAGESLTDLLRDSHAAQEFDRAEWEHRIHPDDRQRVVQQLERIIKGDTDRCDLSYRLKIADGTEIVVRDHVFAGIANGRVSRLIGVTKTEKTEHQITPAPISKTSQIPPERLREFIDSLPVLAWEADPDGWIYYYNKQWYEYTGTTLEQMEGWGWISVHDQADLPRMLKVWRQALETGQAWEDSFRLRGNDGQFRWFLSRSSALRDEHGQVICWFGTNVDIHDQKLALQERERLLQTERQHREAAERANREKDEFLAVVSHELRTPLSAILGWAKILSRLNDPEKIAEAGERIGRNGIALGRLIEDLLDVSRIVSGKLEFKRDNVDAVAAVKDAIEAVQIQASKKQINIRLNLSAPTAVVAGDALRLQQVVSNLLTNAVKFSHSGQVIEVSVRLVGGSVEIRVQDWGEGIDPGFIPQIFNRFTQANTSTRRSHGGLGLGLSIVRHLVELHGGTIDVFSAGVGHGATFTVHLPLLTKGAEVKAGPVQPTSPASLAGISVLCVDDESETRDLLTHVLLSCGATVTAVGAVAEFLERLKIGTPDVVISDISMPEVDGYGLIERIRTHPNPAVAKLPVIALTAHATESDRRRALMIGFDTYFAKPFDPTALSHIIKELAQRRA